MSGDSVRAISITSRVDALGPIRAEAKDIALAHGFDPQAAEDFALCVHEAVSNAIVHGNREVETEEVELVIEREANALKVTVRNGGPGFDPGAVMRAMEDAGDQPRGRGMQIIRSLTDEFHWSDEGRQLTFVKRG